MREPEPSSSMAPQDSGWEILGPQDGGGAILGPQDLEHGDDDVP